MHEIIDESTNIFQTYEFTNEFIEINLIVFSDIHTNIHRLWLLESLDLIDRRTENPET